MTQQPATTPEMELEIKAICDSLLAKFPAEIVLETVKSFTV